MKITCDIMVLIARATDRNNIFHKIDSITCRFVSHDSRSKTSIQKKKKIYIYYIMKKIYYYYYRTEYKIRYYKRSTNIIICSRALL